MNFEFAEEQKAFAEQVRRFAREHLAPGALKRAHDPGFPFDVAKLMAKQRLMGITLPESEGGQGGTLMDAVIAIEQVAAECPRSADVVQFGNFGPIRTFAEYGRPAQKSRWLGELLAGRMVMSLGMTEPDAGSALTDLKTTARADGSHYVINGGKVFSTFSPDAQIFLVYVRFGAGVGGIGSVIIERGTPGFSIGAPRAFMSDEEWCELAFKDCRVPAENVLLGPGGFKKQMDSRQDHPSQLPESVEGNRSPASKLHIDCEDDSTRDQLIGLAAAADLRCRLDGDIGNHGASDDGAAIALEPANASSNRRDYWYCADGA